MCGRFSLTANNDELHQRFGVSVLQNLVPRWNIAPSQSSLVCASAGWSWALKWPNLASRQAHSIKG